MPPSLVRLLLLLLAGPLSSSVTLAGSGSRLYSAGPFEFEPNRGQADASVEFLARGQDYVVLFTPAEVVVHKGRQVSRIAVPGKGRARIEGTHPLPGKSNYFIGSKPAKWRQDVPHFAQVRYREVYPGADLVFSGVGGRLERAIVASGAAVQPRQLSYVTYLGGYSTDAGQGIAVDRTGNSYVTGYTGSYDFPVTPGAAQTRFPNAVVAFVTKLASDGSGIVYSTYLGGDSRGYGIAIDAAGNAYVTGTTNTLDFPSTPGGMRSDGATGFVAKLNATGDAFLYSALIPASPSAIALDALGNAYLTGSAVAGLPTTPGALQPRFAANNYNCAGTYGIIHLPCRDAFVAKVNPTGSALVYSTYLGGTQDDAGSAIAVDDAGYAHITGTTASDDFPTTPGAIQRTFHGLIVLGPLTYGDAFVAKLNPTGTALVYSTYFGGSQADSGSGIALDRDGNAIVAGWTDSRDFPTTPGVLRTAYSGASSAGPGSGGEGFLAKLNATGQLIYSTYLGGISAMAVAVDSGGNAYVAGKGASPPVTSEPLPSCWQGRPFVAVLNPAGTALLHSTPVPGDGLDWASAIAVDWSGAVYVTGTARSLAFFSTPGAFRTKYNGGDSDAFVAKIDFSAPIGVQPACLLNAASYEAGHPSNFAPFGTVAPGEVVSIFGVALGPSGGVSAQVTQPGVIVTELAGTRVLFDGVPAPLLYVQANQINAVVPFAAKGPSTKVVVESSAGSYGALELPVDPAVPGIFANAILNEDGTLNSPTNPAARGSAVVFYATGAGRMEPPMGDGSLAPLTLPLPKPALGVSVLVGGQQAAVEYAGAAPGLVAGVIQVNVRVPQGVSPGSQVLISLYVGDYRSQLATVAVR